MCLAASFRYTREIDALENAARRYPVLFMHDGQNVWDDHHCCFGHTGWEVNGTLDTEDTGTALRDPLAAIGKRRRLGRDSRSTRRDGMGPQGLDRVRSAGSRCAVLLHGGRRDARRARLESARLALPVAA
jgi:hypothetical protein